MEPQFLRETSYQCVVLAGGLGTRIRGAAPGVPKCLIPVAGKPFIEWQLRWLADQGASEVVICIGYRGDQVRAFVGDGKQFRVDVTYVDEGSSLKGGAGALRLALDTAVLQPWFFVLYGDSYLDVSLKQVAKCFRSQNQRALMTVHRNENRWEESNVIFDGALVTRYEKNCQQPSDEMVFVDYGLLAMQGDVVAENIEPDTVSDLAPLLSSLALNCDLTGFEVRERFFEIGTPEGLSELELHLVSKVEAPNESW
jgi:NDP-sugar pyrophosphorylase family protein